MAHSIKYHHDTKPFTPKTSSLTQQPRRLGMNLNYRKGGHSKPWIASIEDRGRGSCPGAIGDPKAPKNKRKSTKGVTAEDRSEFMVEGCRTSSFAVETLRCFFVCKLRKFARALHKDPQTPKLSGHRVSGSSNCKNGDLVQEPALPETPTTEPGPWVEAWVRVRQDGYLHGTFRKLRYLIWGSL